MSHIVFSGARMGARVFVLCAALIGLLGSSISSRAQTCLPVCGPQCVKPWAMPDRWDDATPIPGYDGHSPKGVPSWVSNGKWDHEAFTDLNGNGLYDPGEPFVDANGNGKYDEERYDPLLTGYIAAPCPGNTFAPNGDLGLEIQLSYANTPAAQIGQYRAIDLPPVNRGNPVTGGSAYRDNIANCNPAEVFGGDWLQQDPASLVGPTNQGMRALIAQDPDAYWDPITNSVQGSPYPESPRIVLVSLYDPRLAITAQAQLHVVKVVAFFMEQFVGQAMVVGRLTTTRGLGAICDAVSPPGGSFITYCPPYVPVDIRPGKCPNRLNPRSHAILPVAILGTHDFDVTRIDPASIRLAGVSPLRSSLEDVATPLDSSAAIAGTNCNSAGPDGLLDLALEFDTQAVAAALGPVAKGNSRIVDLWCYRNQGIDPGFYAGQDMVTIVGNSGGASGSAVGGGFDPAGDDSTLLDVVETGSLALSIPNPCRRQAAIVYTVPRAGAVRVTLYDVRGHRLATLVNRRLGPGRFNTVWDGKDERGRTAGQGVYFVRLQVDAQATIEKIVLER